MSDSSTEAPGSAEERSAEAGARPSVPESRRGETLPHRPTPESMVLAIYILYLIGLAVSFAAVIGLLVAYSSRAATAHTWLEGHVTYQIRTFWIGLAMFSVGFLTIILGVGILILLFFFLWAAVRSIRGLGRLSRREPMPDPRTLMW
jgi:uncharacterized membrane protein